MALQNIPPVADGKNITNVIKEFLISTDYPYFRDDPKNWEDRLNKIKSLGISVLTSYIPWRHHEIEINGKRQCDFTGKTSPNRDVVGFFQLCQEMEFKVIAKPGPFIHAELNYGGLPNWVCPNINLYIEPMLSAEGIPFFWGGIEKKADGTGLEELPLPSPLDPVFLVQVEKWLRTVTEQVIAPFAGPSGPVICVQVGNEGIYSNYQRAPWAYDYSNSSLHLFRKYLQQTYGDVNNYNRLHGTNYTDWQSIEAPRQWKCPAYPLEFRQYQDWSAYQSYYMRKIFGKLSGYIPVNLPFVINANPPTDDPFGLDAWLSRVNPDELPNLQYGYTNWIGVACKDPGVIERYQTLTKRAKGINYEENWGFSKLYEKEFEYPSVCFFQTMIQIASGAKGYNIYTGVGTRHATADLDLLHQECDYPDCAPITSDGQAAPKAEIVRLMDEFFTRWGSEFLECEPVCPVAFGLYLPYAQNAVWVAEQDWEKVTSMGIPNHGQALQHFQRLCLAAHVDFDIVNLQTSGIGQHQGYPTLVLASGRIMDKLTQEKLVNHVQSGVNLVLIGEIPSKDSNDQPLLLLDEIKHKIQVVSIEEFLNWDQISWNQRRNTTTGITPQNSISGNTHIWHYSHPHKDIHYLFIFSGSDTNKPVEFDFTSQCIKRNFELLLPPECAGVVRIVNGQVSSLLVKGKNEEFQKEVIPFCRLDKQILVAERSGDWLVIGE